MTSAGRALPSSVHDEPNHGARDEAVSRRMDEVCGAPPRLDPVEEDAMDEVGRAVVDRLRELTGFPPGTPVHPFFKTLAHQPDCFAAYMQLGLATMERSMLPPRTRELIILRTGWLCGAPYQFGEHVLSARRIGVTGEEIERIKQGSQAPGWDAADAVVLRAAEELHAGAMIQDATWRELAQRLSPAELIELTIIVGHYHTTAFVQNALRIPLSDYNVGLASS